MEHEISFYILHCVFFYNLLGKFNDKDSFSIVSQNIDARRNCAEKNEFDSVFYVFYVTRIQLMIQQFIFQLFSKISIETLLISLFERRSNMFRITHFDTLNVTSYPRSSCTNICILRVKIMNASLKAILHAHLTLQYQNYFSKRRYYVDSVEGFDEILLYFHMILQFCS